MNYLSELATAFRIPTITNETRLTNGKTAATYLLHTNTSKKYILKTIDTKEQAYFEYKLIQHIRANNRKIVSEILTTKYGEPFIQIDKTLFQVQTYIPSVNEKAPLQKVLNAYRMLQEYLEDFHYERTRHNRFAVDELWIDTKELLHNNFQMIYKDLCPSIEKLTLLDNHQENWIHGDLGAWNHLLSTEGNVCFIDFSEARKGPKYFDLVAIFASYLPRNLDGFNSYTQEFLSEYKNSVDLEEFYQTIELWYIKGILSLLKVDIQSMKEHVLYFYSIIKYIKSL